MYKLIKIFVLLTMVSCQNSQDKNLIKSDGSDEDSLIIDSVVKDTNEKMATELLDSSNYSDEVTLIPLIGDKGVIEGILIGAELGDYGHITIKDSANRYASFYLASTLEISDSKWEDMLDGKYNNHLVRIEWRRFEKYIEPAQTDEVVEEVVKIDFI